MASVSKELAPVVAKLGPKGMTAIVVDCVHKFMDMCLNLALSAAKIGIEGVVIVTTTPEMCPRFKEVLGEYSFCVNSTDAYNIAHKHLMETNNCLRPFHKWAGWRWGAGYYKRVMNPPRPHSPLHSSPQISGRARGTPPLADSSSDRPFPSLDKEHHHVLPLPGVSSTSQTLNPGCKP